jgi:hypothetical protein
VIISLSDLGACIFLYGIFERKYETNMVAKGISGEPFFASGYVGFLSFIWIAGVHTTKLVSTE